MELSCPIYMSSVLLLVAGSPWACPCSSCGLRKKCQGMLHCHSLDPERERGFGGHDLFGQAVLKCCRTLPGAGHTAGPCHRWGRFFTAIPSGDGWAVGGTVCRHELVGFELGCLYPILSVYCSLQLTP